VPNPNFLLPSSFSAPYIRSSGFIAYYGTDFDIFSPVPSKTKPYVFRDKKGAWFLEPIPVSKERRNHLEC